MDTLVFRGLHLAPVPLNLAGKDLGLVGLGSYIINAQGGCNDCHTAPPYAPDHDPYLEQPKRVNGANYLAGGQPFGPGIVSSNITPCRAGKPAGLELDEFLILMRTGKDPDDPSGRLLQVMPWPVFGEMTDCDLRAVYEFLRAILAHNEGTCAPDPGE